MCEHKHEHPEAWVTPEDSRFLSSKQIILHHGQSIPKHTTGPSKEEVIVCTFGSVKVHGMTGGLAWVETLHAGNYLFIPEDTDHSVEFNECGSDHAIYVYVVNKVKPSVKTSEIVNAIVDATNLL